jgi:hypothetical protein
MPLSPEQFASGVESIGATLVAFDQTEQFGDRAYMGRGACRSISAVWLRNQKLQSAGTPRPGQDEQLEEISWLAEQQHLDNGLESVEILLGAAGLRRDATSFFKRQVNWDKLWFFLAAKPGYYLVGADPVGAGAGHEIAFDTRNGYKLFDPNYGQVTFGSAQALKTFFGAYWGKAYPELTAGTASIFRYV